MSTHDPHGSSGQPPEQPPGGDGQHYWLDEPKNIKKVIHVYDIQKVDTYKHNVIRTTDIHIKSFYK